MLEILEESEEFKKNGHPSKKDFTEFGHRIGVAEGRIEKLLNPFLERQPLVEKLIHSSFLSDANKKGYLQLYNEKRNHLSA